MSADGGSAKLPRYHSLDRLRAVMMLLGLVLHASVSYVPELPEGVAWPYVDARTSPVFDWLIVFIHVFRMPVFFTVAGFFAAFLVATRGIRAFLRHRWSRIGVPFLVGWLLLAPATLGAVIYAQRFSAVEPPPLVTGGAADVIFAEGLLMHLWFLYHLLLFCAGAALVLPLVRRIPEPVRARFLDRFGRSVHRGGLALLVAAGAAALYGMRSWTIDYAGGILPQATVLATYGLFFLFGWLLFKRREVLQSFVRPAWRYFAAGVVCFLAHRYFVNTGCGPAERFCDPAPSGAHLGAVLFLAAAIWFLVYGFLGLFLRYMERPNDHWRYLADASYWMYLVHPPLVMVLPTLFADWAVPAGIKFGLVLAAAAALTLATYHYLVRATFIGKLLNGRRYPRAAPRPA